MNRTEAIKKVWDLVTNVKEERLWYRLHHC